MTKPSPFKVFYSKVLLFGEHLVNLGCDALSMPYSSFKGVLKMADNPDDRMEEYLSFLRDKGFDFLDSHKLKTSTKLVFDSNIPEGYGAGSSGALVAACYDYFKSEENPSLADLKSYLSQMESYFHGVSSGTDPLVSYLNSAVRFKNGGAIQVIESLDFRLEDYSLVLVDSGHAREGKEFINWFMKKSSESIFENQLKESLILESQSCIDYLSGDQTIDFVSSFQMISDFQLKHMKKMIPNHMESLWKSGLDSSNYFLKICGAGGGGFFIALVKTDFLHLLSDNTTTYSLL